MNRVSVEYVNLLSNNLDTLFCDMKNTFVMKRVIFTYIHTDRMLSDER